LNIQRGNGAPQQDGEGGDGEDEGKRQTEVLRKAGDYEVSGGWLREEAIVLLRRFYVQQNTRAPEPRAKKDRVLKLEVEPVVQGGSGNG
jgi:tRNA-specific adenosine deaminase 2